MISVIIPVLNEEKTVQKTLLQFGQFQEREESSFSQEKPRFLGEKDKQNKKWVESLGWGGPIIYILVYVFRPLILFPAGILSATRNSRDHLPLCFLDRRLLRCYLTQGIYGLSG